MAARKRTGLRRRKKRAPKPPASLKKFAARLGRARATRKGHIVLRLVGRGGGAFCFNCTGRKVHVAAHIPRAAPLIEVMGDAAKIRSVLEGRRDGRKAFLTGGIRVRGDMNYLSELAVELGFLKAPL